MRVDSPTSIDLHSGGFRLDASYYASPGQRAMKQLVQSGRKLERLAEVCLPNGIFIPGRFKRIFIDDPKYGAPYLTGSSILQAEPKQGVKLLSFRYTANQDRLALHEKMILITCSGEIGNTVYVNGTFRGAVGSPDLIRVLANPEIIPPGYLYAYLSSSQARALIQQKTYGAVIPHIEAHHVLDLPIPRLEPEQEQRIHELIEQAAELRVQANQRLYLAQKVMNALMFGDQNEQVVLMLLKHNRLRFRTSSSIDMFSGDLRLDASYHASRGHAVLKLFVSNNLRLERLDQVCLPGGVFIPGRFKRIYVNNPSFGAPYLTGGFILNINPLRGAKLLSHRQVVKKDELILHEKMILITCSGIIGNTVYVNANFRGAVGSPDLIRIVADSQKIPSGYLFAYLSSPVARLLIQQKTYGAVIPHIEAHHLFDLPVPRFNQREEHQIEQLIEEASHFFVRANEVEDQVQEILVRYLI